MNRRQKIALVIIAAVWVWIALGGPYNATFHNGWRGLGLDLSEEELANPPQWTEIDYCFERAGRPYFPEILRAWIALLVPGGITIYLLKTRL